MREEICIMAKSVDIGLDSCCHGLSERRRALPRQNLDQDKMIL